MTYALFLDDERYPACDGREWRIARSMDEAKTTVVRYGVPEHISFDHDLGTEETGLDFANWLIWMDLEWGCFFDGSMTYAIHSQNPNGAANIRGLLEGYIKQRNH